MSDGIWATFTTQVALCGTSWAPAAGAAMLGAMSRPNSVLGLFRRLVVARWKKLSLNIRLAILAGGLLVVAAIVSGALGLCPASGGCCMSEAAGAVAPADHPVITAEAAEAHDGCPFGQP